MAISGAFPHAPQSARFYTRGLKIPRLSVYVFGQLLGPVAMLAFLLTSMIWLVTTLQLLDLVINRGQSAVTFTYLALLYLPTVLTIILPFALLFGALFALPLLGAMPLCHAAADASLVAAIENLWDAKAISINVRGGAFDGKPAGNATLYRSAIAAGAMSVMSAASSIISSSRA